MIDLYGWDEVSVRRRHPGIYQHLLETVKADRDRNARAAYRANWWMFGEPRRELRAALEGLDRFIVTVETGKHRWFRFLDAEIMPDNRLVCFASNDPFILGVLSSRVHTAWAKATGGLLEDRPVYVKSACFDRFPFPIPNAMQREDIAVLAEDLDRLRREVLDRHDDLTMTGLYNARERRGQVVTEAEHSIRQRGCVGLIDHLHTRIDAEVIAAYGWPQDITDDAIFSRLVDLNAARAVEESQGEIRWLRPSWQQDRAGPRPGAPGANPELGLAEVSPPLPAQDDLMATALLEMLRRAGRPMQPRALAHGFAVRSAGGAAGRIERVLAVLAVAGSVHRTEAGWYAPRRMI